MSFFQSLSQEELSSVLLPLSRSKHRADAHPAADEDVRRIAVQKEKQARYRAKQIYHWFYQRGVTDFDQMTDLAKDLRAWLRENMKVYQFSDRFEQVASDGTRKLLWRLADGHTVESVIIPADVGSDDEEPGRMTACISTQVGCAMGCRFCLTGSQGFDRNLEVHEIVSQVHELNKIAPLTNIVFMGMGEPLQNLDAVIDASRILLDQDGMNFSKRKITVSTSGWVPGIDELGKRLDISLAVSLNATTDEQRDRIMPVNRKYNIAALLEACRRFPLGSHRRITFEYVLLADINDSIEDADRLVRLMRGVPNKINLISFNEHPASQFKTPGEARVRAFQKYLLDRGLTAIVRASKGREISAACGQLKSSDPLSNR